MKKVVPILILILIILIVILSNSTKKVDEIYKEQETKVSKEIMDLSNITQDNIKKNINDIKENYKQINKKDSLEKVIYSITYLEKLLNKISDNDLKELVTITKEYIETNSKENKDKITSYFNKIENQEDELIENLYNEYNTTTILEKTLNSNNKLVIADLNDPNMINEETINRAIDYIKIYYKEPYKNDEIINKITYYSIYLSSLSNETNEISTLGVVTLNYLQTLSKEDKDAIEKQISIIKDNQESMVKDLLNNINN